MARNSNKPLVKIALLISVLALTFLLFWYRDDVHKIAHFGYGGIFLLSILTNATLILPLPGVVITSAMGMIFNPLWVAVAAGVGAAIGEITGYIAGFSGQIIVDNAAWYDTMTRWMKKYGNWTILVMALIPNPFFDLAGMAAGMLKLPLYKFLIWCSIGKIIKMIVFAYSGASIFKLINALP